MTSNSDPQQGTAELTTEPRPPSHRDPQRGLEEITAAAKEMEAKVWYDRHRMLMEDRKPSDRPIPVDALARAESAARTIEATYGKADLGPYSDFEWGMLNGKLSALRWVMGDEWDFLDT